MKFTWFNLMPWPALPDDFRSAHRSVWVDIPSTLYDPRRGHFVYHEYMDQLEYAEALGFDGIGVNEHHQNGYGLMPSPNIIAGGLARRTSRAAICVIGNSIALYNPPIRVAEEFAMLDVISGGRLVAGFPVGTPMDTNFCYGQIPALTRDKYREAHELIMRAWAADEPFAFDGKYNQLRWVNCWPKPIQKPHPPIYIPGGGSIETWDFCLDHDYNYSYLSFFGYRRAKALMDGYWSRVAKRGKDESPYRAAFAQIICVADSDSEAEELYAEHCLYFFNRCLHVFPPFADPPGYRTIDTIKYGALSQLSQEAQKVFQNLTWKQLVEERFVVAGSPDTVRQQLEEAIVGLRVGHIFCLFHNGDMPDWKTRHSSKPFAEKVMPRLRDLWPEWQHDNRWWITPMEDRLRPDPLPGVAAGADEPRAGAGDDDGGGRFPAHLLELLERLLEADLGGGGELLHRVRERRCLDLEGERQDARRRQDLGVAQVEDLPAEVHGPVRLHRREHADAAQLPVGEDLLAVEGGRVHPELVAYVPYRHGRRSVRSR